ncbi:MAG: hypothetical protein KKE57_05575 [Proteobacteria bacterium]|nr:hypothetical protein [Pseudomonadota bacterium]
MSEKEMSLGRLFVREAVRAATWGIILLIIMGIFITSIKQDIKEGIAYGVDRAVHRAAYYALDPALIGKTKQLIKEGIEYTMTKASKEAKEVLEETSAEPRAQEQKK